MVAMVCNEVEVVVAESKTVLGASFSVWELLDNNKAYLTHIYWHSKC